MAKIYQHSEIFKYEGISQGYIALEGRLLSPRELIIKASKEEEFDVEYVNYIISKHKMQMEEFILRQNRCIGNSLRFIKDDYWLDDEDEFEPRIISISFKIKPTVFDILDVLLREKQWDLVFYVYYRETFKLNSLINHLEYERTNKNKT